MSIKERPSPAKRIPKVIGDGFVDVYASRKRERFNYDVGDMASEKPCPRCGGPVEGDDACPWCRTLAMDAKAAAEAPPVTPPAAPPVSWKRVGKYFLTERLGIGGMGEVWKALDTDLGRHVALKFLKASDEDEIARFRREAQTVASLNHPHIASIYEVGEIDGRHFIAMSYVRGRTLSRLPRDDRKLFLRLVRDAARAVEYANREGIIHRDIKPENIMATEGTSGWHVTVLDFGLARPIEAGQTLSRTGLVLGTPAYMSPEQTRGEKLDSRTDVYSLGATLFELLAGRPPFVGANPYEVARKVLADDAPPLRQMNPRIHQDLETIVQKCLEKDRERRYATAGELADDLDRFLEGEPIQARPARTFHRLARYCAKRRGGVAVAVLGLLLVAFGVMVALDRSRTTAYLEAMRRGRDAWEDVVKATTSAHQDRARGLAGTALDLFEAASRARETADAWVLRGRCLQVLGRAEASKRAWDRALALDPGNAEARYQSAKVRLLEYQRARGTPLFQPYASGAEADAPPLILEDLPPETEDQSRLRREAEALLAAGDLGAPEKGVLLRGLLAMGAAKFAEAADLISRYTRIEPWDAAAMRLEAIAAFYAGAYDRAGEALDRVLAAGPDADAYLWRGIVNLRKRQYEAAFADSTRAIQLDPTLTWAYRNRARAHRYRGDVDAALEDLSKALELSPEAYLTYIERAYLRNVYRGDLEGALADADRAVQLHPASAYALQTRASIKSAMGDLAGVAVDAARALELEPGRHEALILLVPARLAMGDVEGARAAADRAVAARSGADAFRARAVVRDAQGDGAGALDDLNQALALEPNAYRSYLERARIRGGMGDVQGAAADHAQALMELDRSFETRPRDPRGPLRRGQVREAMGDRAAAVEEYTRAIELDPKLGPAWAARAALRLSQGAFDAALKDARRALRPLHFVTGTALLAGGDFPAAVTELTRSVERSGEGRIPRALAYLALGEGLKAAADLEAEVAREALPWRERDRIQLLLWIVRSRRGDSRAADAALDAWFQARTDASLRGWYRRAAEVLLGRLPEGDLRALLPSFEPRESAERACEADYYAGLRRLLSKDPEGARAFFERAARTPARRDLAESLAASIELRGLEPRK
jgi:tetratricopeptide (TPR) repeat protein